MKIRDPKRFAMSMFAVGILAGICVTLIISLILGTHFVGNKKYDYYKSLDEDFGKYYTIESTLKENALYTYDDEGVDDIVARGIVSGLKNDKYAAYLNKREYSDTKKRLFDTYIGIGVGIQEKKDSIVIVTITKGGPADEAGLKKGDVISKIDGHKVKNVDEALEAIEGMQGTGVKLSISRGGKEKKYTIYRSKIDQDSVNYRKYRDGVGYIKIERFMTGTTDEFNTAVSDLKNQGCKKLIIDLRNNGGGITSEGIGVADKLLPACNIITCKYKNQKDEVKNSDASNTGCKYVLLVNEKTASASEIVTVAVKDNKGGKIIGTKTYGKGLIQSITGYNDGTALKYTIGEYYSPNGTRINGKGIDPDVEANDSNIMSLALKALGE